MSHPHRKNRARIPTKPGRRFVPANADLASGRYLDPVLTRKATPRSHMRTALTAGLAILFVAYIFNAGGIEVALDGCFNSLYATSQTHTDAVGTDFNAAVPYFAYTLAALVLYIAIKGLLRAGRSFAHTRRLAKRDEVSLVDFCAEAQTHDISLKIAREAYRLLLPHCREKMRARLDDHLQADLRLTHEQHLDLYANLLMNTDRKQDRKAYEHNTSPAAETLLDLMTTVQNSPRRSTQQSAETSPQPADAMLVRPARVPKQIAS